MSYHKADPLDTMQPKPVYLTKEERARIALEVRERKVAAQKTLQKAEKQMHESMGFSMYPESTQKMQAEQRPDIPEIPFEVRQKEIQAIKNQYMGLNKKVKKARKLSDRKFVFDWDGGEDTSIDFNDLYARPHQYSFYGRGRIGGLEPCKDAFYSNLLQERRNEDQKMRAKALRQTEANKERRIVHEDRHWGDKELDEMRERDWRIFKEDFDISTKGGNIPHPLRSWNESELPPKILQLLDRVDYVEPTPIQRQAIPIGLENRDLIGIAQTGSGKTAAFVLPMLVFISELPKLNETNFMNGPYAIILAPTRELALQIESEASKFARPLGFTCVSIVGGHSMTEQSFHLRNGAEIVIATPGRLKDCLEQSVLVLHQCSYVVLDEADRMLSLGFEPDLNFILDRLPVSNRKPDSDDAENSILMRRSKYRQTTMFSATMKPEVERLARNYLRRPAVVVIGEAGSTVATIQQVVEMVPSSEERKRTRLLELLHQGFVPPIIVFVNTQKTADTLSKYLDTQGGYRTVVLHGGKDQERREIALTQLKEGAKEILVATDVAGRGIDIKNVSLVINFDMAKNIDSYIHRIGRTGRAGKSGTAITFLTPEDTEVYYDLKQVLIKSSNNVCPHELASHEAANTKPGTIKLKKKSEETIYKS